MAALLWGVLEAVLLTCVAVVTGGCIPTEAVGAHAALGDIVDAGCVLGREALLLLVIPNHVLHLD